MFAVGNGPKSRYDEIRISKVILRTGDNKQNCNIGGCQNSFYFVHYDCNGLQSSHIKCW